MKQVIAFVMPEYGLPVPAIQGGAIETLMTMLLEENERQAKFRFVMVSYNTEQKKVCFRDYKNTRCYYCHPKEKKHTTLSFGDKVYFKLSIYFPKAFPPVTRYYKEVYRVLKKENPDYVIGEGVRPEQLSIFLRRTRKEHLILHLHHHFEKKANYDRVYGKTIAISQFIADEWNKTTPEYVHNTFVWKNCIQVERFKKHLDLQARKEMREKVGFSENDFVVLFCGRIVEVKGIRELIQAINSISYNDVKLLIIGSSDFARGNTGEYVQNVFSDVAKSNGRIKYLGYIKNEELYQYYQLADIQAVPSLWEEAAGLVVLEGMISKLPLIITESGGMVEYVDRNYTQVIPKDENIVEHLREKILLLRDNSGLREKMADGAFQYAERYTAQKYYADFCEIVEGWD